MGEGGSTAANPNLGTKIMKNLAGGGKDRERPREKVEKRLTEVSSLTPRLLRVTPLQRIDAMAWVITHLSNTIQQYSQCFGLVI